jgi:hypothetical protein
MQKQQQVLVPTGLFLTDLLLFVWKLPWSAFPPRLAQALVKNPQALLLANGGDVDGDHQQQQSGESNFGINNYF